MIDLVALDALRAVGTHGSLVAAAADALGFTPSAVSQQVKRLERQTGVPLLERVGRGVMLTGHGQHLVEQGTRLLADLEELQSGLHRQAATVAGHVRLTAFSTAMRGLVAPALPPVLAAHPDLRVTLTERSPRDTVSLVASGQADLGVAHSWGDLLPVPDHLARRMIGRDLADVIVPRGHPLEGRAVVTPRDLAGEDWVATAEGTVIQAVAAAHVQQRDRGCRGSRTCRWSSTATWPSSAPASASPWSRAWAARPSVPAWPRSRPGRGPGSGPGAQPRDRRAAPRLDERLPGPGGAPDGPAQRGRRPVSQTTR